MEGNLQLTLTKEQAALLAPILQQILPVNSLQVADKFEASQPQPGQTQPNVVTALPSTSGLPEDHSYDNQTEEDSDEEAETVEKQKDDICDESFGSESGAGNFTVSDLLKKKKRNAKSTKAQNFLNVRNVLSSIVVGTHACSYA